MSTATAPVVPAAELERLRECFPSRGIALGGGVEVAVRECGAGTGLPLVCLHGIGSGAASWLGMALLLSQRARVLAWDAPGYGASTPLPMQAPRAADYAARLHALLDALGIGRCVLVGHSLGALMAAAAARDAARGGRFAALILLSPAQGYGAAARAADAARVREQRQRSLAELGIAGMAEQRSSRLLSPGASPEARAWVRWNMARLHEGGYRQAIELLCGGDLLADLPPPMPVRVACGALDEVTPPTACAQVAERCGVPLHGIEAAGHACYVEQPAAVARLLGEVLDHCAA